jgi:hypothetical protein
MIRKSLIALLLAYLIVVMLPFFLQNIFIDNGPPSDSYSSITSFHMELYGQIFICICIVLLFFAIKLAHKFFKIDQVIYFHFLIYLFFYNITNLILITESRKSELFYSITGARKIKDPIYGYIYPSHSLRHESIYYADSLLLTATYSFDSIGRRYTPQTASHKLQSVIFFGCSYTYGDGVNDSETLPAQYARLDTCSSIYNYAIDGWGPAQTLQELLHKSLANETQSDTATGIYVWIDDHLKRASLYKSHYLGWTQFFPCFVLQNDSLVYKGNFESVYPIRGCMFQLLNNSIFLKNIDIPAHESAADYQLSCAILKASQVAFLHQFKSGKFIVFLYPDNGSALISYLKKAKIDYIVSDRNLLRQSDFIPRHGHPNKSANLKLAHFLYSSIGHDAH